VEQTAGSKHNLPRPEGKTKEKQITLVSRQRINAGSTHGVPFCAPLGKVHLAGDCGYQRRIHLTLPNVGDGVCCSTDQSLKTGGTIHRRDLETEMVTRNLIRGAISGRNRASLNYVD
jgi:hypothetical protein